MIHIVHQLRMARGSISKLRILRENHDNEDWKKVLLAMYDSSINYYVSAPRDSTFNSDPIVVEDMLTHLGALSSRSVTGHAARYHAQDGSQQFGELYRLILGGSLKCGVSITTLNKAYPQLIPQFKVMLAKDMPVTRFPCIASTKYDGVRLLAFVAKFINRGGWRNVELRLRSGKLIQIDSLEHEMSLLPPGIYDGELVAGDGLQEGRTKITGSVNRCLKGSDTDIEDYTFCVFDHLLHEEWEEQQTSRPYVERLESLRVLQGASTKVKLAEMYNLDSIEKVNAFYASRIANGYEGIIIRYSFDPYTWDTNSRRGGKLIKQKATFEGVLECSGVTNGKNKYEGLIGALVLRGKIKGKEIRVKTGSGLSDHDRELAPSHFIGKDIEMLYNDITLAEDADYYSLFLPRFKRVRGDHNV